MNLSSQKTPAVDERGAVAVFTGAIMVLVLVAAAFVIDVGIQRVARADMQALSDLVALDLSRELDGSPASSLQPHLQGWANASRDRNLDTVGERPTVIAQLGELDAEGEFAVVTGAAVPTAVKVTASTDVDFSLAGITGVDSGGASRSAVAVAQAKSCIRVGSYVATVDTAQSALLNAVLGGLLRSNLSLTAVHYNNLAGADLTLLELVQAGGLGVGTVDELLALENVSVGSLFVAAATALDNQGNGAAADALHLISVGLSTPTVSISDLVDLGPGASALDAGLNILNLVQSAAFVANGESAVEVPNLGAQLGIANVQASLQVIEPPRVKCGGIGTQFDSAQVRLNLTIGIPTRTVTVPGLGALSVELDASSVGVSLDLGKAIATLKDVSCNPTGVDSLTVSLRSAVIGALTLSGSLGVKATLSVPLLNGQGLLGGLLTTILGTLGLDSLLEAPQVLIDNTLTISGGASGTSYPERDVVLPIPGSYTVPAGSGSGSLLGDAELSTVSDQSVKLRYYQGVPPLGTWKTETILSTAPLFSQVLTPIVDRVLSNVLDPLVTNLQDVLVKPLTKLLGVQLGGADVWAVPTATCGNPRLAG